LIVTFLFEPGFFSNVPVQGALVLGAIVALVSAVVGTLTVLRSQSFAGHALTDVATTGGAAAAYYNVSALAGFVSASLIGAGSIEAIGADRVRRRDIATGIVLGAATGLSALFLWLDSSSTTTGASQQILFGSIFSVPSSTVADASVLSAAILLVVAVLWRPLLLSAVSPEIAAARGIRTRLVGLLFTLALAVTVGVTSIAIGSILSTALLIGPAAAALRVTRTVVRAMALACALGVAATWLGILFAYDSPYWNSSGSPLPVSFFIVAIVFFLYLVSGLPILRGRLDRRGSTESGRAGADRAAASIAATR
jgi:zinc/manganese transport system permease protein